MMSFKVNLWLLVIPFILMSCQNKKSEDTRNYADLVLVQDSLKTVSKQNIEMRRMIEKGIVLERARSIFSMVRYNTLSNGGAPMGDLFDRTYCSKSWNKMLLKVRCKEEETATLFFEIEHWTMTREPGIISFDDFEVTRLSMDDSVMTASVNFIAYSINSYTPARVDMVYEDGRWVIDNFHDLKYKLNARESMKYYLREEMTI